MPKVAIIMPEFLPVPAVNGGGVETLITGLLRENDVNGALDIDVYSIFDVKAEKFAKNFKYSNFLNCQIKCNTHNPFLSIGLA